MNKLDCLRKVNTKFEKVTELNPEHINGYFYWGKALLELERYEEAIIKFDEVIKFADKKKQKSQVFLAYYYLRDCYQKRSLSDEVHKILFKNTATVIDLHKKTIDFDDDDQQALSQLQECQKRSNARYREEIAKYEVETARDPNDVDSWYGWGLSLYKLEKYEEAIDKFGKVIENRETPKSKKALAHYYISKCNYQRANYKDVADKIILLKKAINHCSKAIDCNNKLQEAHYLFCKLLKSIETIETIETIDSKEIHRDIDSLYRWGKSLYKLERYDEAIAKFEDLEKLKQAVKFDDNVLADSYFYWGKALCKLAEYNARCKLEKYAEHITRYKLEKYEDALEKFKEVTELNPEHADGWCYLGYVYYQLGELGNDEDHFKKAIANFSKSTELNPEHIDSYCYWVEALLKLGKHEDAIIKFEEVFKFCNEKTPKDKIASVHYSISNYFYQKAHKYGKECCSDTKSWLNNAFKHCKKAIEYNNKLVHTTWQNSVTYNEIIQRCWMRLKLPLLVMKNSKLPSPMFRLINFCVKF